MKLEALFENKLHVDVTTLHSIDSTDPFSKLVKEVLFERHPVLSNSAMRNRRGNASGCVVIDPIENIGNNITLIKDYILKLSLRG